MFKLRARKNKLKILAAYSRKKPVFSAGPSVATIETTTRCNLKCDFCYRRHDALPEMVMPFGLFKDIIENDGRLLDTINLFGIGEPLLDPHIYDRIELCTSKGILTHVATNATLLDDKASRDLLDSGIRAVTISMDSLRPDVYERMRPGAKYHCTVSNILGFLDMARNVKRPPMMVIQMFRTSENEKEMGALKRFWLSRKVDEVRFCSDEFNTIPSYKEPSQHSFESNGPCLFLWQGPALVRADGGIYGCCNAGLSGKPMANAADTTLFDFWTGEKMERVRVKHIQGMNYSGLNCYSCKSQKPIPVLGCLSCLGNGMATKQWGIRIEKLAQRMKWGLIYRDMA